MTPHEPSAESDKIRWARVRPPFGEAWANGCCTAWVTEEGRVCGWPRRTDGSCGDGHPSQPESAPTHTIRDLLAADRVARAMRTPPEQEGDLS